MYVRKLVFAACVIFAVAGILPGASGRLFAQDLLTSGGMFTKHHTQVKLLLAADAAAPGDTILAGVEMTMDPGWHTYWKNPGEAGAATKIIWTLPPGVTAGDIRWPLPRKLPPPEVTTYGYEDEVVLVVPIKVETNVAAGALNLSAKVSWLECKDVCVPASANIEGKLEVASETRTSADAAMVDLWNTRTPRQNDPDTFQAAWEKPAVDDQRPLIISRGTGEAAKNLQYDSVDFFPAPADNIDVQGPTEVLSAYSADIRLRKVVKKFSGDWPGEISGTVIIESGSSRTGYDVKLAIEEKLGEGAPATSIETGAGTNFTGISNAETPPTPSFGLILIFAFLGGLILNVMPCVLPVIALKILGFVREVQSAPGHVRLLGLVYTVGVLVSFAALAGIVIAVKAAGHQAGWGMQFGSPVFVVCLTTLVLLVTLNLFGVFEVAPGGRALDAAGNLASKSGPGGAFFNGVLATTLATPCTAPFLASALGFAFSQSAMVILLVFLAAGMGMAAPYLVLSCQPAWLKFLPKPGAWMEKFKIALAFPMLATVVWLFNIATSSYGKNVLWLGLFLVLVAFAAWVFGEFYQRGRNYRGLAIVIAGLILAGGYGYALEKQLDWRAPIAPASTTGSLKESADGIDWQPWSPEAVAAARAAGKPVLVDFTADWCLTCQVNKKTSIEIPSVREKIKQLDAVALLADDTRTPENITAELNRYQRAGVPLVLIYPKNRAKEPIVLPALLTPGIVLSALDHASD